MKLHSRHLILIPLFFIIILFYFWTPSNGLYSHHFVFEKNKAPVSRHHEIAEAFLHKQVHLLVAPKDELLALSDPYDPSLNDKFRLHDAVLYEGKYYHYFSPVVSILFDIPLRVITGRYFTDPLIGAILCSIGLIFNYLILINLFSIFKIQVTPAYKIFSLLALAFTSNIPFLLRRVDSYEVCIASAYCFLMAGIYLMISSLTSKYAMRLKLIIFGLLMGLAFASRPNLAVIIIIFYLFLTFYLLKKTSIKISLELIFFSGIPLIFILICLAYYNYIRFNSILEFGLSYQLAGIDGRNIPFFSIQRVPAGLFVYFFQTYSLDLIFPFFHVIYPLKPEGELSKIWFTEPVIGIFSMPIFWVLPFQILLFKRAYSIHKAPISISMLFIGSSLTLILLSSGLMGVTMRYTVDFLPLLLIGFLFSQPIYMNLLYNKSSGGVKAGYIYFYILIAASCVISFFLSLSGYMDSLKRLNPNTWNILKNFFTALI